MRFKITFNRTGRQRMLPMDYQYFLSAWIYKVLKQGDTDFATFLHNSGYGDNHKLYKLFCFSRLNFGKPVLWKEKKLFEIRHPSPELFIAFNVDEAASNFIKGLFMSQEFFLGDRFNGIDLKVASVEAIAEPEFTQIMHYSLKTPCVVSYKSEKDKHPQYLLPDDEHFFTLLSKHITEKYNNINQEQLGNNNEFIQTGPFKKGGFLIKPGTRQETRVVGSLFNFTLNAPPEIHELIWNAGLCEKSSSGFGWIELE
jgi:CRISPR-associated endoribonuclease Cas6